MWSATTFYELEQLKLVRRYMFYKWVFLSMGFTLNWVFIVSFFWWARSRYNFLLNSTQTMSVVFRKKKTVKLLFSAKKHSCTMPDPNGLLLHWLEIFRFPKRILAFSIFFWILMSSVQTPRHLPVKFFINFVAIHWFSPFTVLPQPFLTLHVQASFVHMVLWFCSF